MFPMPAAHRRSDRRSAGVRAMLLCLLAGTAATSGRCVAQGAVAQGAVAQGAVAHGAPAQGAPATPPPVGSPPVASPPGPASPPPVQPIPLKPAATVERPQQERRPPQRPEKPAKPPLLGPGVNEAGHAANTLRTTKQSLFSLIDRRVIGREKREIGHVIDVLVDARGQPAALVVDVGGFMGMGNRRIAIAWERFVLAGGKADDALQLPLTDAQVKAAPAYDGSDGVTVVRDAVEPARSSASSRVDLGLGPAESGDAGSASDPLNPD